MSTRDSLTARQAAAALAVGLLVCAGAWAVGGADRPWWLSVPLSVMGWLGAMSLLGGLVGLIAIAWARLRWWTPRPEVFYRVEASRLRHVRAHRREYVLGELGLTGDAARSAIDEHLDDYRSKPIARHDAQIIAWIVRRCGGQARAVPDVERTDELAIG